MRQQVPTGFRQPRFEYQMKIVLSKRHLAPERLKIEDFGYTQKKEGVFKRSEKDIHKTGRHSFFCFHIL
jgi:hypothetical protein